MKIIPFKAVLPSKDKVALVTSRAYEDYSVAELASQLDYNPYSFLHVVNPFYLNQQKVDNEKRLRNVNRKYKEFVSDKILLKEEKEGFYLPGRQPAGQDSGTRVEQCGSVGNTETIVTIMVKVTIVTIMVKVTI